ncbi:hypothetical protein AB0C02_27565 [Micromonospora sp. NPDC048999]|uniref:hypothetical protein n=1 Tax=Micromonospora sp. NPDC048999 TaxID=3155391 RepID=UPI0033F82283
MLRVRRGDGGEGDEGLHVRFADEPVPAATVLFSHVQPVVKIPYTGRRFQRRGLRMAEDTKDESLGCGGFLLLIAGASLLSVCCWFGLGWVTNLLFGVDSASEKDGRPCTATVLSVKETKVVLNHEQQFEFRLRVKPDEGPADGYEVTIRDTLNVIEGGHVAHGTEFRCVIDHDDDSRVKVFWADEVTDQDHA